MKTIKQYLFLSTLFLFLGCDDENSFDCFKTVGDIQTYTVELPDFNEVEIIGDIELYIENSITQEVSITTGQNLYPKIKFTVENGRLTISDDNKCIWARKYNNTSVTIKTNNLTEIKNSGSRDVHSIGTYNIDTELFLFTKNAGGDYYLDVSGNQLRVSNNKTSNYFITGSIQKLMVGFFSGHGRFEGAKLNANTVDVFQRGSNDIMVKPKEYLHVKVESFGNVLVYNKPLTEEIELNGQGKVIYIDN